MASLRSLGVHAPAGLPYLIGEGILREDATPKNYSWEDASYNLDGSIIEEELLWTDFCVVFSRGGVTQKVFNFEVEQQKVVQAILTWFYIDDNLDGNEIRRSSANSNASIDSSVRPRRQPSQANIPTPQVQDGQRQRSRALVIFLKFQAHVYFLTGSSHVVNLPFEVDRAFATPKGLLLQRKAQEASVAPSAIQLPAAPPNSFITSNNFSQPSFRLSSSFGPTIGSQRKARNSARGAAKRLLDDILRPSQDNIADNLPRLYSFTDPLSELGLVVDGSVETSLASSRSSNVRSRYEPLDKAETVIYASSEDELDADTLAGENLLLVVTANRSNRTYSIWRAVYPSLLHQSSLKSRRQAVDVGGRPWRRSSHGPVPGTGTTTPGIRLRDGMRESFGGAVRGKSLPTSQQPAREGGQGKLRGKEAEAAFASQLDPDNSLSQQVPKESRRVSSMLSRGDLSTSFDRSAFQDLAAQASFGGPGNVVKRGPSLGIQGDRVSFGGSQRRNRASTPGSFARLSLGDISANTSEADLTDDSSDDELEGLQEDELFRGLRKEVALVKVTEIPFGGQAPIFASPGNKGQTETSDTKVFVLRAPDTWDFEAKTSRRLYVSIASQSSDEEVEIELSYDLRHRRSRSITNSAAFQRPVIVSALAATAARRVPREIGEIKLNGGACSRSLSLHKASDGSHRLFVHTPWQNTIDTTLALGSLKLFNPYSISGASPSSRKTAGLRRTLRTPEHIRAIRGSSLRGCFDLVDNEGVRHTLQVRTTPRDDVLQQIFRAFQLILPNNLSDLLLSVWWTLQRTIHDKVGNNVEWTAFAATVFTLPIPFVDGRASSVVPASKTSTPRSTRQTVNKTESSRWSLMWESEKLYKTRSQQIDGPWAWAVKTSPPAHASPARARQTFPSTPVERSNTFILTSIETARTFRDSDPGRAAEKCWQKIKRPSGADLRAILIAKIIVVLHFFREELNLNVMSSSSEPDYLGPICAQMGHWLRWTGWGLEENSYFKLENVSMSGLRFETSSLNLKGLPSPPWNSPPALFEWMDNTAGTATFTSFPTLYDLVDLATDDSVSRLLVKRTVAQLTPRTIALSNYFGDINKEPSSPPSHRVELLLRHGLIQQVIETLPEAFAAPLHEAIATCRSSPPTTWTHDLLQLVGRKDLILSSGKSKLEAKQAHVHLPDGSRDFHTICKLAESASMGGHTSPENDRFLVTRLIFHEDRRYTEAVKLLDPQKQTVAECKPDPAWNEAEYLDKQKEVMQWVMLRTFALPPGHAMINYNLRRPLLTERYSLHGFTTSCLMKPMNNVVTADRTAYTEEKFHWAFFHAGVFAGLTISRKAKGIDTSWIVFNKPAELTNKHAGLLFGLGLNGHLKSLAKWLSFKYLTPKHTMTTVGLLLGLSASFLGTMDTLVTRLLSVHVTRMLPPGAAELNLSPFTQTTGLMGIGLLYCNTQHRRMSEIMLSEIEHVELTDPSEPPDALRDEGYRLAAGFALGLINLGRGKDLRGLHDMHLFERLLAVAVGPKPVDEVHILDQATPGATIAYALIYMKTMNEGIARRIDVPDTLPQFDYVRPDVFLLRTLAKHLIMWDNIQATPQWMAQNLPRDFRSVHTLRNIRFLKSEHMPFYNIVAGLLWSIALKHVGSGDTTVRDFLLTYLDELIRINRLPALRYDAKLTRNTVRNCQDLVALATASVMAGTGDLLVFRRLRALHGRVGPDTPYGSHMAAHHALGALFLGGGTHTFGNSNLAIAALICAFYPLFPTDVTDNKAHLQAFRHFWALAAEPRCVIARDVDTGRAVSLPIIVEFVPSKSANGAVDPTPLTRKSPCLLPPLDSISRIRTHAPDYWPVTLDFAANPLHLDSFHEHQTIFVARRPAHEAYPSIFNASLASLNTSALAAAGTGGGMGVQGKLKWKWVFKLPSFADFDASDISLILPEEGGSAGGGSGQSQAAGVASVDLDGTTSVVDERLVLSHIAKGSWRGADLWNLRVLFTWAEKMAAEAESAEHDQEGDRMGPKWLGREALERLRGIVAERMRVVDVEEV